MSKWLPAIFFMFLSECLFAQEFGGHPPSIKWRQINTDTARVIFPSGYDSIGQRVATLIHQLAAGKHTLGNKLKKINIVLQNQTTVANGYVALGPYRSEFQMTPTMNNFELGTIDWPASLALHEWRHVQQYNNFNTGLSKVMGTLFGEEGLVLAINASVPEWFYEGDAVYNETIYSGQGRGGIPFFTNQYPTLWNAGKKYSWMKLRNGSLKHFVPSHYQLGYLLVNYGYEKYGIDFWKNVTNDAASFKSLFYPFQSAIKKFTGVDYKTFIQDANEFYKTQLQSSESIASGEITPLTKPKNYVTNYYFPYQLENDTLLYLKNSYKQRRAFMYRTHDLELPVRVKDISLDEQYSYRNGRITYAAYKPDIRWAWKDYSEIKILDLKTRKQKTLTKKSKYFTPDISEDGKKIVAVDYGTAGISELHILDAGTGEILKRFHDEDITLYTNPKFVDDNSVIVCSSYKDGKIALSLIDISSGITELLIPPSFNVIGYPTADNGKIFFTRSYQGNDELFYIQLSDKKIYRVTNTNSGNYFVNASSDRLVFSSFTADGYQLKETDLDKINPRVVEATELASSARQFPVGMQNEYEPFPLANLPLRRFSESRYSKGKGLLNFHSWRPYYEDPEFTFSLYGQNILNTLQTEIYYLYNQNENTNAVGFSAVYGGLFPYISAGTEYTFKRTDTLNGLTREWNQLDSRIGLNIPLNLSGGRFFRFMNFGSSYVLRVENNMGPTRNTFAENTFSYLSHFFSYSQQVQQAAQHIYPRLGFNLFLQHRHTITDFDSYQYNFSSEVYLPGFLPEHNIVLQGAFQQRDTFRIVFSNRLPYARGFNELHFSRMWKSGVEYHLPLFLPDWGFANILYIQRIRAAGFYDFMRVFSRDKKLSADQRSVGVEIYADTKWWNQYPLTFGIRFSKRLDADLLTGTKGTIVEIVLPVSIIPR